MVGSLRKWCGHLGWRWYLSPSISPNMGVVFAKDLLTVRNGSYKFKRNICVRAWRGGFFLFFLVSTCKSERDYIMRIYYECEKIQMEITISWCKLNNYFALQHHVSTISIGH